MFGFRNRANFNGEVDAYLNSQMGINTNSRVNRNFPGTIAYVGMLDAPWNQKASSEAGALHMAILYHAGLVKNGGPTEHREAREILSKIQAFINISVSTRKLDPEHARRAVELLNKDAAKI